MVLVANAVICTVFMVFNGLFTAQTAHWIILTVLLTGGFFRSLQFTALNAIAYADLDEADVGQATALVTVTRQLAVAVGVALAAFILEAMRGFRGEQTLVQQDFAVAFFGLAALTLVCAFLHLPLKPDAGAEVSGHKV